MENSNQKPLGNTTTIDAVKSTNDIQIVGNPDKWVLICKASSERQGWMKSTKAYELLSGCLIQVSTEKRNPDGSWSLCEAIQFIPNLTIRELKKF